MNKTVLIAFYILFVLLAFTSIFMIARYYVQEKIASNSYLAMLDYVAMGNDADVQAPENKGSEKTESVSEPETKPMQTVYIDFDKLIEKYPDVIGWLYCEGTPINYPVMQCDNNDFYLRHLPDGTSNAAGSLFADYRCDEIGKTSNFIIYGHNMSNGTMFGSLTEYKSQSYYDEHPVMYLFTQNENYKIELIAGFVSKPTEEVYNTEQTWENIMKYASVSTFRTSRVLQNEDFYVTLSTCSYEYENARYVLIGKLCVIP